MKKLSFDGALKRALFVTTALGAISVASSAHAQADTSATSTTAAATAGTGLETVIVTAERTTRSSVVLSGVEIQKLTPGISPLKAIETLPGVLYETADPWGNNEQNEALIVHGFTTQQLGYTMDGVPLGDQQYGNYNGLSPSRAVTSENVATVTLQSGAGSLGVASTSNLGGAIETVSLAPTSDFGVDVRETLGNYDTTRTFVRVNTGEILDGNTTAYVSYLHHDARAWDFDGHQRGDQVNLKVVHDDANGKLTVFGDWQYKVEPNEDAVAFGNQQVAPAISTYFPYTRPFLYPNLAAGLAYVNSLGAPPSVYGNNFSNYFSAAQRMDVLTYAQYDWNINDDMTWSNQVYYHHDTGRGIVAGPVNQAGLPGLFAIYYPQLVVGGSSTSAGTLANLVAIFGGTGYEVRTTEYRINREGARSTFNWQLGDHQIEAGIWYEHNDSSTARRWYPFSATNDDLTPYDVPRHFAFTQYYNTMATDDVQLHIQDAWHILPTLVLTAGIKSSLQTAGNNLLVQQQNITTPNPYGLAATNPQVAYPTGSITSDAWFLPQVGATWDASDTEQLFFNVQKNMRQFIPYGAGSNFYGASPWSLGSQDAFNQFKATAHPETAWAYEVGIRTQRDVHAGWITAISGQANYYHVDFANRLLNVAAYNFINPNPAVLVNVGSVTTNGVDVAGTLYFGDHFQFYDGISYNKSTYDQNYNTATGTNGTTQTTVHTAGKQVPLEPDWMDKFIFSTNYGPFEAQFNGDFVGRRYVTYLNDLSVKSTFVMGFETSYHFALPEYDLQDLKASVNVTNINNTRGVSTAVVTGASGGYQAYPIAPPMVFVTLGAQY